MCDFSSDLHRPRYHLMPRSGWMNDPNGAIQWGDTYHLFYQHNPKAARWDAPHWGHAYSRDLVSWHHAPIALSPATTSLDDGGCWSGCAVGNNGAPTLIYTAAKDNQQSTHLAYGDETLTRWHKEVGNPVALAPKQSGWTHGAYRDPYVWREGEVWYQVIGTSLHNRGQALLLRSYDLKSWTYLRPLIPQEVRDTLPDVSNIWECPNFFKLGDTHVLIVSLWHEEVLTHPVIMTGTFVEDRFYPQTYRRLDAGERCFYAPLTLQNREGRRLMWGWLQEQRGAAAQLSALWSGVMSLPRELTLDESGDVKAAFVPELHALRQERMSRETFQVETEILLPLRGRALELKLTLRRGRAHRSGVNVLRSAETGEETSIYVDWHANTLEIDKKRSSLNPDTEINMETQRGLLGTSPQSVTLHIYIDQSVIEVIADDTLALSTRVYTTTQGEEVQLFAQGGDAAIHVEGWTLAVPD